MFTSEPDTRRGEARKQQEVAIKIFPAYTMNSTGNVTHRVDMPDCQSTLVFPRRSLAFTDPHSFHLLSLQNRNGLNEARNIPTRDGRRNVEECVHSADLGSVQIACASTRLWTLEGEFKSRRRPSNTIWVLCILLTTTACWPTKG